MITPAEAMTNIRQEAICGSFWAVAQIHDGNIGSSRFLKFSFTLPWHDHRVGENGACVKSYVNL